MRVFVAAMTAVSLAASSALAADPFHGNGWQRSRPPAAVAYFKMPLQADRSDRDVSYGLAITAPTPRRYDSSPLLMADAPKLADLRFNGFVPETLRFSNQVAWSMNPDVRRDAERQNLLGIPGIGGTLFGLALAAGAVYGGYEILKKKCPAVSTTTGGCVDTAN